MLYADLYIPTIKVALAIGNGNGTYKNPKFFSVITDYGNASIFNRDIDAADMNGDGLMDMLVTTQTNATVSLLMGKADGTLAKAEHYGMGVYHPKFTGFADYTNDGAPDVVSVFSWPPDIDGGLGLGPGLVFVPGRATTAPAPISTSPPLAHLPAKVIHQTSSNTIPQMSERGGRQRLLGVSEESRPVPRNAVAALRPWLTRKLVPSLTDWERDELATILAG